LIAGAFVGFTTHIPMERDADVWQFRLPVELQTWVIWPLAVESFHEESVPAAKWRGYDTCGQLCYYRHVYSLWEDVHDDEEPFQRLVLSEFLEAWRTLDGRWIRSIQRTEGPYHCRAEPYDSGFELVPPQAIPRH
jgi:hypothetical protein